MEDVDVMKAVNGDEKRMEGHEERGEGRVPEMDTVTSDTSTRLPGMNEEIVLMTWKPIMP